MSGKITKAASRMFLARRLNQLTAFESGKSSQREKDVVGCLTRLERVFLRILEMVVKVAMNTNAKSICVAPRSGMGIIWGSRRIVPWPPAARGAPTIRPKLDESMKSEFKSGFPPRGDEGGTEFQLNPFH